MDNPNRTYSMYVDARNGVAGMSIGNEKIEDHTDIGGKPKLTKEHGLILPSVMMKKSRCNVSILMGS